MELKPPKPRKKGSVARLLLKGRMLRTPVLILFLLGSTTCDNDSDSNINAMPTKLFNSSEHRHRHKLSSEVFSDKQSLTDIKYLRRHLNKEMVNFVMTDVLVDGEIENRVHYNGLFLKETSVKSHGSGLHLRQLTDGNHLLQIIYAQNNIIQDCEVISQPKASRNFLKKLRKEIKTALDEQQNKLQEKPPIHDVNEKLYRRFANVTFRILKNGAKLPQELVERMDYEKLKMECKQKHEELKFMIKNKNKISEQTLARSRKSLRENFILPGTMWCGAGQLANNYTELGEDKSADRCCRSHDNCRLNIGAFQRRFGYHNLRFYTVSHCACDRRFRACLKLANTSVSNLVGNVFFNVLRSQCFVLKPMKMCTQRSWWGTCLQKRRRRQAFIRSNLLY